MPRLSSLVDRLRTSPLLVRLYGPRRVAPWTAGTADRSMGELTLLQGLTERWQRYQAAEIDRMIAPVDDMKAGASAEEERKYFEVGRSAIELITDAMVLARRTDLARILDFPCGGGRVTRHLVKFFPDSEISASDIEREKQAFVVSRYGAKAVDCPPNFTTPLPVQYDLIFVGSLFTHLDAGLFERALDFFLDGLATGGILVMTLHGRYTATAVSAGRTDPRDIVLRTVDKFARTGFSYVEQERTRYGVSYGASFSAPSWVASLIERRAHATLLAYKERAWDNHQDALIVQKLP
jgi:SAM-dependent methyltransferase